jgi:hypothetical protein
MYKIPPLLRITNLCSRLKKGQEDDMQVLVHQSSSRPDVFDQLGETYHDEMSEQCKKGKGVHAPTSFVLNW